MRRAITAVVCLTGVLPAKAVLADLADEARAALAKATDYMTGTVAAHGGYLWWYSADLKERAGEGTATETQIWVQPPGTPSMGMAFLRAYEVTGDERYLEAAKDTADALIWGRLASGGWDYKIDFDPQAGRRWHYQHDVGRISEEEAAKRRDYSVFDDNTSQSAVRLLMRVDKATGMEGKYHDEGVAAAELVLKAQFGNGGWPQVYPPPKDGYAGCYTFNDNAINDCIAVLIEAYQTYAEERHREGALRGGHFIIASQLPAPQAGWAQQYGRDLKPAPARWFEPAAVCSAVTVRNIGTLLDLYLFSGEGKYLEPIPAAVRWLEASAIGDNLWARFYEPDANRPIYVNMDRQVVYEFVNIRPGYSWQADYGLRRARDRWRDIVRIGRRAYLARQRREPTQQERRQRAASLAPRVADLIAALDAEGRWLVEGRIQTSAYIANARTICDYLEAAAGE